jgi:glycosyltransferase involved in cell wall biosynthesis
MMVRSVQMIERAAHVSGRSAGPSVVAVVPGSPYDPLTWSGCSPFFLNALERSGCLAGAVGGVVPPLQHKAIAALLAHPKRNVWRFRAHASVLQRRLATHYGFRELASIDPSSYDTILQTLNLFDFTGVRGKRTVSYNDTNLLAMTKFYPEVANPNSTVIRSALRYESGVYERTDLLFTMSRWAADTFIRDVGIKASKLEPVGAGINVADPEPCPNKRYDTKNILFIGRDFYCKGGYTLLEAFERVRAEMPAATLTLIGSRDVPPVPAGVTSLGFVSKRTPGGAQTIIDAYHNASVFVMPSLWEPFGIAILEAQAHALPCVGSDAFAMTELIRDTEAGYVVTPKDSAGLARALLSLLKDPTACAQMGANGRRRQQEYYTWGGVAQRIRDRLART